jgi:hypothetical protein
MKKALLFAIVLLFVLQGGCAQRENLWDQIGRDLHRVADWVESQ